MTWVVDDHGCVALKINHQIDPAGSLPAGGNERAVARLEDAGDARTFAGVGDNRIGVEQWQLADGSDR